MSDNGKREQYHLGFLTAIELPDRGFVGGLLGTNRHGRPLEFQCTAPVRPNRTPKILYGPTLVPHILTDLIAKTLVEKAGVKPDLILTDRADILPLRDHVTIPVACVNTPDSRSGGETESDRCHAESADDSPDQDNARTGAAVSTRTDAPMQFTLGRQILTFHEGHASDGESVRQHGSQIPRDADLQEPFERVRAALEEAVKTPHAR